MAADFKRGDRVEWNFRGRTVRGTVRRRLNERTRSDGRVVAASKERSADLERCAKTVIEDHAPPVRAATRRPDELGGERPRPRGPGARPPREHPDRHPVLRRERDPAQHHRVGARRAGSSSTREKIARSTSAISACASAAPMQRRMPPPNGSQV